MVEDNKQLASRIDGDLQSAHHEVNILRQELADTNKRITELQSHKGGRDQQHSSSKSSSPKDCKSPGFPSDSEDPLNNEERENGETIGSSVNYDHNEMNGTDSCK